MIRFQRTIIREASAKLGRPLTRDERAFVTRRSGLLALEAILDTVRSAEPEELAAYLSFDAGD